MKKSIKSLIGFIFGFIAAFLVVSMAFNGCNSGSGKIKKLVSAANKVCPVKITEGLSMESVTYDNETVAFNYLILNNDIIDIDKVSQFGDEYRKNILQGLVNNPDRNMKLVLDAILEADADLEIVFRNIEGKSLVNHFTAEELKAKPDVADPMKLLEATLSSTKMTLPTTIDNGLVLTDVFIRDGYWYYSYQCDENLYTIDLIQASYDTVKEALMKTLIKQLKEANTGLAYMYNGGTSGKSCTIFIEPDEI